MRVGINARTFSVDEPGGAVQASIQLTKKLIDYSDLEIILFGSSELAAEFDAEVHSLGFVDNQALGLMWERTILPLLAKKTDIDVLYCPNGNGPLHNLKIPVIMCVHDVNAQKGLSSGIHQFYRKLAVPVAANACDKIVTVSEFSKDEICTELAVPEEKVQVIYNGVDDFYFDDESTPIDLPERYLLFVGSLNPRKNIEGILQSFNIVQEKQDIDLVLVGPSNKNIFQNLKIDPIEGIHLCGYLEAREVKYTYENAEALVYPSFYEGFGLPPLEAMACGTPVVSSNQGALPEILGDCAVYVDPNSSSDIAKGIEQVLKNNDLPVSKLRKHAEQYTWESVAERLRRSLY